MRDPRFALVAERAFPFSHSTRIDGIVARALSTSYISLLPEGEQERVRARIMALADRHAALRVVTEIPFPHVSLFYLLRRP